MTVYYSNALEDQGLFQLEKYVIILFKINVADFSIFFPCTHFNFFYLHIPLINTIISSSYNVTIIQFVFMSCLRAQK